uniref:Uncharacterized protein n=1 Tax=viral metagenome TaxID=1070528 RepID=A0A6C0E7G1_9ZZZZ
MVKSYYYIPSISGNNPDNNPDKLIQYYKPKELPIDVPYLIIKMGQSDIENTKLVTEASDKDWWFHLADFPSAHALTYFELSKDVGDYDFVNDKLVKLLIANIVKKHSKQKNMNDIKVLYCQKSNLHLGDKPGLVILKKPACSVTI